MRVHPYVNMFSTPCAVLCVVVVVGGGRSSNEKKKTNLRIQQLAECVQQRVNRASATTVATAEEINLMAFSLLSTISIHYATFFSVSSVHFSLRFFFLSLFLPLSLSSFSKVNFYFVFCYQNAYMTFACESHAHCAMLDVHRYFLPL